MEEELSEAMTMLTHFWECAKHVKPFSEARFRGTLQDALTLAIKGGLQFDIDDCGRIKEAFAMGGGYFREQYLIFKEGDYLQAIIANNISACHAFEHRTGRKPFIVNQVDHPYHLLRDMPGRWDVTRSRDRLGIDSQFKWNGEKVTVTSFDDKNGKVICCGYKPREREKPCETCGRGGWEIGSLKVSHVYKLTHNDLKNKKTPELSHSASNEEE